MSNTGCKKKKCGCEDQGLTTPTPCAHDTINCPINPCAEIFSACCSVYGGDSILDTGINKGDNLCLVIQKLSLLITNPTCALPTSTCQSVLNLASTLISSSTVNISWTLNTVAPTFFQTEYKVYNAPTWIANPQVANTVFSDAIGGLVPDTFYEIRVKSVCQPPSGPSTICYSLTILVKTNQ